MVSKQDRKDAVTLLINALGAMTVASTRLEGSDEGLLMDDLLVRAAEVLAKLKRSEKTSKDNKA